MAAVGPRLLLDDPVVSFDDPMGLEVAAALRHPCKALHVAEHERHAAVRGGMRGQVRPFEPDRRGHGGDGLRGVAEVDPLGRELGRERCLDQRLHPELLRGGERLVHELERPVAVAGPAARLKHAGVVVLRAGHPGARPDLRVGVEGGLEVPLRLLPARHGAGQ